MTVEKYRARGAKSAEAYYRCKIDEMRRNAESATEPSARDRYLDLAEEYRSMLGSFAKAQQPDE